MTALWIVLGILALGGALAVARSVSRLREELSPTLEAFGELRATLVPVTASVTDDAERLRRRLAAREAGRPQPHG